MSFTISMDSKSRSNPLTSTPYEFEKGSGEWQPFPSSFKSLAEPRSNHEPCIHFSAELNLLRLPYSDSLLDFPEIYVAFDVKPTFGFSNLVRSTVQARQEFPFICKISEVFRNSIGVPIWIYYECVTRPILRLDIGPSMHAKVKMVDRYGNVIDLYPLETQLDNRQTHAVFELVPVLWDGAYDNINKPLKLQL